MSVFRKVLYSTDFSPLAEHALNFVKDLKSAGAEEVILVHVVDSRTTALPEGVNLIEKKTELAFELPENEARQLLKLVEMAREVKKNLEKDGFKVSLVLISASDVVDAVVKVAEEEKVDVIVVGAHGKGLLAELILGSVSLGIIRKARCPVLLVRKKN
ncbi:universal stress protein [Desulfurobacterium sp.]